MKPVSNVRWRKALNETPRVLEVSGNHSRRRHGEARKSNEAE
ncbi:MAG: hypothetical protein ACP5NQ_06110 [Vulcanisaeta sp.]